MQTVSLRILLLSVPLLLGTATAQQTLLSNSSFEEGQDAPTGWTASGGECAWISEAVDGARAISVTGSGQPGTSNYWRSDALRMPPQTIYQLQFRARRLSGSGGLPISGPVFCNRDLTDLGTEWTSYTTYFITPTSLDPNAAYLRFGQWEVNGSVAFDAIKLLCAEPVYFRSGPIELGAGESISGRNYVFAAPLDSPSGNQARPLVRLNCTYNAPRMVFGANSELVYRHQIGTFRQSKGSVEISIGHYVGGELSVSAGTDGQTWQELGVLDGLGAKTFLVSEDMLPREDLWVRLQGRTKTSGTSNSVGLQVYGYTYRATLDAEAGEGQGKTTFWTIEPKDPQIQVSIKSMGEMTPGGTNTITAEISGEPKDTQCLSPLLSVITAEGTVREYPGVLNRTAGGNPMELVIPYEIPGAGAYRLALVLGGPYTWRAETTLEIPSFYETRYGERLPGSSEQIGIWWASSGWKIPQIRPLPQATGPAMRIQAARNETEAAQLVIRPTEPLTGFTIISTPLIGAHDASIPASNVETLRVRYVNITQPTDGTGVVGWWPDPLPPFTGPVSLEAGKNQPIWIRVNVPRDTPAGTYTGTLDMRADGFALQAPLEVTVFDFELPDQMTCTSAFGFSPGRAFRYHKARTLEEQRAVYDLYLDSLSAHHISPYSPAALDPFQVTWPSSGLWQGGIRDRSEKHHGESALLLADDNSSGSVHAAYEKTFDIPAQGLRIQFWYKTREAGQRILVTLRHFDAQGEWMSGRNNDIPIEGNGQWQFFDCEITTYAESARQFSVSLWPTLYTDDGSTKGTAWFDEVRVTDRGTDQVLLQDDFEPLDPALLKPQIDWSAWDAALTRAFDRWHFNGLSVPIIGMGGGTFHERTDPSLFGYAENTPEYQTAFSAYCRALEEHLRERGWLDKSYVYWFDEPDPKDYEFVMNGFRKLKENAPGIGRMLTEQVEPALIGGPNIWCPLTPEFKQVIAEQRHAQGERFWWYICTGPKAPYATLFIDHPGTELRVWLWQTWQRRIDGILIWESNYWTSEAAYPDPAHLQNPYEDPMSWVVGYSTPAGSRLPWGNGDGRFLYPPESAADGNPATLILEKPVDSIRIEMLRDGLEDYEYMVLLDRMIKENEARLSVEEIAQYQELLKTPESVTSDITHFTQDPQPIEQARASVAHAIEKLSHHRR